MIDRLTRLFGFHFGPNAAAEWVVGSLLTRGTGFAAGTNINAASTISFDVECGGSDQLDVIASIGNTATVAGDIAVTVRPYRGAGNNTIIPGLTAPQTRVSGPILSAGNASVEVQYDVSGYSRIRIDITNNNAAAQVINDATWRLS